ncbi:hypothetical protein SAMN05216563_12520 [Phytobacter palmae]|nr:hypothetical protein SAMN05216563_12520 [Phytobacter palmae]
MEQGTITLVLKSILLVAIGTVGWLYTNHKVVSSIRFPKQMIGIKRCLTLYSRYIYSGGKFRRTLFLLVFVSLALVFLFDLSSYKFLENMAFSVIAAYIFDLFINFQKEHQMKFMISRHWHSAFYDCYQRERVIVGFFVNGKVYPNEIKLESLSEVIFKALVLKENFFTRSSLSLPWSIDGNGIKMLNLPSGSPFDPLILDFIREDARFINPFYLDEKVTASFPALNNLSHRFSQSCLIFLNMIESRLGIHGNWKASDEVIHEQLNVYLSARRSFLTACEMQMGHYGILGF